MCFIRIKLNKMEEKTKISGTIIGLNFQNNEVIIKLNKKYKVENLQGVCYNEEQIEIFVQKTKLDKKI